MTKIEDGTIKAVVSYSVTENGKTITKEEGFEGTKKEVDAAVDAFLNENATTNTPDTPDTPETPESAL